MSGETAAWRVVVEIRRKHLNSIWRNSGKMGVYGEDWLQTGLSVNKFVLVFTRSQILW